VVARHAGGALGVLVTGFPGGRVAFSGGTGGSLLVVASLMALVRGLAAALDRAAAPGRCRRSRNDGSTGRGMEPGSLGPLGIVRAGQTRGQDPATFRDHVLGRLAAATG
jgi:hypothetical protein